eukprot:Pgem_evm1s4202
MGKTSVDSININNSNDEKRSYNNMAKNLKPDMCISIDINIIQADCANVNMTSLKQNDNENDNIATLDRVDLIIDFYSKKDPCYNSVGSNNDINGNNSRTNDNSNNSSLRQTTSDGINTNKTERRHSKKMRIRSYSQGYYGNTNKLNNVTLSPTQARRKTIDSISSGNTNTNNKNNSNSKERKNYNENNKQQQLLFVKKKKKSKSNLDIRVQDANSNSNLANFGSNSLFR